MNEIDPKALNEVIRLAKKAVQDVSDPILQQEVFRVVLSKLLDSVIVTTDNKPLSKIQSSDVHGNLEQKKEELAIKCAITKAELGNVISIHNNSVEIVHPILGSDAQKHIIGAQIVLIAYESIFDLEWIPSSMLTECFRGMGVKDLANISFSLKRYPELIRSRGTRGHKDYKLTSSDGRRSAYELIGKLAKGESLNEN